MTDINHTTGTDRVFEASKKLDLKDTDFIMNIQGDEPMINHLDIKNLNKLSKEKNFDISTLAYKIYKKEDYNNENIVKVITKNKISDKSAAEAINFHRLIKEDSSSNIYQHFGIYLYKYSALKKFVNFEKSVNETKERLEQLRAIDNNMKINVILAKYFSSGIDTKKDLEDYIKSLKK
tara:strand:- start:367 stop:900 length:534 start_codon:yes stop_codon:yes gene_type:complete